MTRQPRKSEHRKHRRSGLAPLEMVLSLPILLFVMGLMVVFGAAGAWKVRAHTNSRYAVWRTLDLRTGGNDGNPTGWPQQGTSLFQQQASPTPLTDEPFLDHPVVRGPQLNEPNEGKFLEVILDTLEMQDGLNKGFARIQRDFVLLKNMPPRQIDFSRDHLIFGESRWTHMDMNIGNDRRRILTTYDLVFEEYDPDAAAEYQQAAAIVTGIYQGLQPLRVIDRDEELADWFGSYINFHPRPQRCASNYDPQTLWDEVGENLVDRIQGKQSSPGQRHIDSVAETIAKRFRLMYQQQKAILEAQDPPPQAEIDALQELIDQLNRFLQTFPP